jgi:hypothetical protein
MCPPQAGARIKNTVAGGHRGLKLNDAFIGKSPNKAIKSPTSLQAGLFDFLKP